jgi:hypothetical protein
VRFARAEDGLIGRWPRRLAALACLGLALLATAARQPPAPSVDERPGLVPGPGQRTVPVSIPVDPRSYLHIGDVVELLAAPADAESPLAGGTSRPATVVAARAVVLSIGQSNAAVGAASWPLVVSVDEQSARQVATLGGRPVLAALAGHP